MQHFNIINSCDHHLMHIEMDVLKSLSYLLLFRSSNQNLIKITVDGSISLFMLKLVIESNILMGMRKTFKAQIHVKHFSGLIK